MQITTSQAFSTLAGHSGPFVELFKHGTLSLELYQPKGQDFQVPHDRDEVYVIISGSGIFENDGIAVQFNMGDFLFVPAFVPHRFVQFSDDFATWVLFYGPRGGENGAKVAIEDWQPHFQPDFFRLNKEWIEQQCPLEPLDIAVLSHPDKHIIDAGGQIFVATNAQQVVGVVALRPLENEIMELTKMAVEVTWRGKGVGEKLIKIALYEARKKGSTKVVLFSNRDFNAPAVNLYHKLGFNEIPLKKGLYHRANIMMEYRF